MCQFTRIVMNIAYHAEEFPSQRELTKNAKFEPEPEMASRILRRRALLKMQQHKRLVWARHWDPSELTHLNGYFDEDILVKIP